MPVSADNPRRRFGEVRASRLLNHLRRTELNPHPSVALAEGLVAVLAQSVGRLLRNPGQSMEPPALSDRFAESNRWLIALGGAPLAQWAPGAGGPGD